jgi:hypothetical protein
MGTRNGEPKREEAIDIFNILFIITDTHLNIYQRSIRQSKIIYEKSFNFRRNRLSW